MPTPLNLLPQPQQVTVDTGSFALPADGLIALAVERPAELFPAAQRLQAALHDHAQVTWQIAGGALPAALTVSIDPALPHAEGYRLVVAPGGITITGHDAPGAFYGMLTLIQLVQTQGRTLPCLRIEDWPDFPARGVMLDISRDKVPTMDTLYALVDRLAGWKINQFQLYTEHTFAYQNHRVVWEHASPMTAEQILALDAFCRARFIELVPNQNSFGHMHRWFDHAPYKHLAELEADFEPPWGGTLPPFSLSPAVPESLDLVRELFAELLPNFSSRQFNVGCDETFDLGKGRSKALVEQRGKGRVYLDFLLDIYRLVKDHGHTMQFWGDIINQYPDLVPEVPNDTIALEWGYEADHDFAGKTALFAGSGIPFYVCPGTSSWTSIAGRTDNCTGNIRNAVENGLKHGAIGVLNTDWGDWGHWQTLPVSYLGFAYGAALSWAYTPNVDIDLPAALDAFAFEDRAGVMGRLAYDLGNAHQQTGLLVHNGTSLFWFYHNRLADLQSEAGNRRFGAQGQAILSDPAALLARLRTTVEAIDNIMSALDRAAMQRPDAALIQREFRLAADMLRHAAHRVLWQAGDGAITVQALRRDLDAIEAAYRELWLARNRPGGLEDSLARLHKARTLYHTEE